MVDLFAYSTQPLLAWCLNHFFYGGVHFTFAAGAFHPRHLGNPKSSNPYEVYGDLLSPWADDDPYDKFIAQLRLGLGKGILANAGSLPSDIVERLTDAVANTSVRLFMPVVYRVNLDQIEPVRLGVSGSGLTGSREYLVTDLGEHEFELLFADTFLADNPPDPDISRLLSDDPHQDEVLEILEARMIA